jgi:hypothetical protein
MPARGYTVHSSDYNDIREGYLYVLRYCAIRYVTDRKLCIQVKVQRAGQVSPLSVLRLLCAVP